MSPGWQKTWKYDENPSRHLHISIAEAGVMAGIRRLTFVLHFTNAAAASAATGILLGVQKLFCMQTQTVALLL